VKLYGVMAEFASAEALVAAVRKAREAGHAEVEAYSPFPIEGIAEATGLRRNWVPAIVLGGGLAGGIGGYFMQWYSAVLSYPINSGGKPPHSWPEFIPVTFELTVLVAAIAGVIGMLALNGLPRLYHPVFNVREFDLASRNRFFICLRGAEPQAAREFLRTLQPLGVWDVPQ
jgi:ActD protein